MDKELVARLRGTRSMTILHTEAADAIESLVAECDALRAEVETLKDQITHELIPDAANASLRASEERERKLRGFAQDLSDSPCDYGDGCPPFVRLNHYRCLPCKARAALKDAP